LHPTLPFSHLFSTSTYASHPHLHSFPTRRSSDLAGPESRHERVAGHRATLCKEYRGCRGGDAGRQIRIQTHSRPDELRGRRGPRSEEHTSELQSLRHLVCRLLLEKKKKHKTGRNI